jgi:hypothetical protein
MRHPAPSRTRKKQSDYIFSLCCRDIVEWVRPCSMRAPPGTPRQQKENPDFERREKNEEIISRSCQPRHKRATSFTNTHKAVRLHFLPMLSKCSWMSKTVQHAGTGRHSTTGDVFAMRALPVNPSWWVNTVHLSAGVQSVVFAVIIKADIN